MDSLSFKTINKICPKKWILMDASNQCLGRFSTKVALRIRGKHKSNFSPHIDCGDHVVVIHSEKIKLTGKKWISKKYVRYTGFPGGKKITSVRALFHKNPKQLIYKAVKGMLPKNRLRYKIIKNLHIYTGKEHKHKAQKPILLNY
ncbi:MAG: 50S ribosomal protein L13 [Flavobacteriales bacterium]|jgi:large subunit ribosomal protein L13|uniref:50S ribosomal protein L13 n=1 Tax=Blattabacterium sp. (Mastotermes darwiniensis) TaxID=39768 RepID=UPI000231DE7D|nr:50S ribosomal protein L13 [Blattabacterium sp. (Mastotermes darwiniensis)]AER40689.1 50S ribosomal protein L13 [Blattabacterium sp. (Mastotermes darwiniensis) str. MADAR]MDR1804783.1 50S ribosomal protein L13 [Flavobacteriales bacterium]